MKVFRYSKYKDFKWDNEILGYISQIHEYKGKLTGLRMEENAKLDKLVEIAKIQSTFSSNKIEGIVTTKQRLTLLCNDKTMPKNREEKEILGYRDVLNTIHENYEYIPLKASYILQLHRDLYKFSGKSFGGKFKNVQNYIAEINEDGTSKVRFEPLSPFETPTAIDNLCEEFNIAAGRQDLDVLILISIFILDFLCIHPFNDGNGRMSRLLTLLLMYKFGYNVGKFVSLEKIIEESKQEYYLALQASSLNWLDDKNDPTPFIKYMLLVILKAYRDCDTQINILTDNTKSTGKVEQTIKTLLGRFKKSDIIMLCPTLSETTIERCLNELLKQNKIKKHGDNKAVFYTRND